MSDDRLDQIFRSPCNECQKRTFHKILCESSSRGDQDYDFIAYHSVIQCQGCQNKSFRYLFQDIEQAYQTNEDGDYEVPESTEFYPKPNMGYVGLDLIFTAPDIVQSIYNEALLAIREDALILGGLGLRATIEAICNDRSISGRTLETRITALSTQGLISKKDAERLHAIRFLGNDAAHEIKKPKKTQLAVALKIVDHLLQSVYILDLESLGKLDTIINYYSEFADLLSKNLTAFKTGDEFPLAKLLGKDVRRMNNNLSLFEPTLIKQIQDGSETRLKLGKIVHLRKTNTNLQSYVLS